MRNNPIVLNFVGGNYPRSKKLLKLIQFVLGNPTVEPVKEFQNFDLENIVTPINVTELKRLPVKHNYKKERTQFLLEGFTNGFDIGYSRPVERQSRAKNLPISIGSPVELWNKIMSEVEAGRFAGPFDKIPYQNFIQSPIGLVPKDGGCKTRLIFHLSYDFGQDDKDRSVNFHTPKHLCSVKYKDIDYAMGLCLKFLKKFDVIFYAKTDLKNAFHLVPCKRENYRWLVLQACHPITGKMMYFLDKNLPFGSSQSCALFQEFSDCLCFLFEKMTGIHYQACNYLDDYMFFAETEDKCNKMVSKFLSLCDQLGCPYSMEKTEWASNCMVFLGILLDGINMVLGIPEEKRCKALNILNWVVGKKSLTIKQMQRLAGILNFLNRGIFTGRPFTRCMYAKFSNLKDKQGCALKWYHHVRLDAEFKIDCGVWITFLQNADKSLLCRTFVDILGISGTPQILFYSDASKNENLGLGAYFHGNWLYAQWEPGYIREFDPSIEYLELLALCIAVFTWQTELTNQQVSIFCDNNSVCSMVNNSTSSCKNCMKLIRLLVLNNLRFNTRIFVKHLYSSMNYLADSLSHLKFREFWKKAPLSTKSHPEKLLTELWLPSHLWIN